MLRRVTKALNCECEINFETICCTAVIPSYSCRDRCSAEDGFFFFQRINNTALLECACIVIEGVDQPRGCFEVADVRLPFLLFPSLSLPLLVWDFLHNLPLIAPIRIVRRNHFAPSPSRTLLRAGRIGGVDPPVTGLKDAKL